MIATVAVCTRDRADDLRETLDALAAAAVPSGLDLRVLVVDNGSRDGTAAVVDGLRPSVDVRHVVEPTPGLSVARNRALDEVGEGWILWIDDDVSVEPGWLHAYADAFRRWPDAAVFGGPIRPVLLGTPPGWLARGLDQVAWAYGSRDLGDAPGPLGPGIDRLPFGGNFALRVDALDGRRFDEALGRGPDAPHRGGEESALIAGLLAGGATGRWVPGARVRHRIGPERQTTAYLGGYAAGDAALEARSVPPGSGGAPGAVALAVRWLGAEARWRMGRLVGDERWLSGLMAAGDARGRLLARLRPGRRA